MGKNDFMKLPLQKLHELLGYYSSFEESLEQQSEASLNQAERASRDETLKETKSAIDAIKEALRFKRSIPNPPSSSGPPDILC